MSEKVRAVLSAGIQGSTGYGLILMDVQMPGMDGIEATRWIRNNGFQQLIIALSAKAFAGDEIYMDAGMNDFMTKPINFAALVSRVDMWLGGHTQGMSLPPSDKVEEMRMLMGGEALKEALEAFRYETDARHQQLQFALAANDLTAAAKELHALCGTYRTYGFDELGHLCQALQESCSA